MGGDDLVISLLICLLCLTPSLVYSAVIVDQLRVDNGTTYTLIHGGDDARLNHSDAEIYCQNLGKLELNPNIHGHLASLHDKNTSRHIMKWLLQHENHYIYIGGIVRKIDNEESGSLSVYWSDGSPDNFQNFYLRSSKLRQMQPHQRRCLAIDYINGQWDVHHCDEKLAFLCEIRFSNETTNHKDNSLLAKEEFYNGNVKGENQPKHFQAHEEVNHFQPMMPFHQHHWSHPHPNHHHYPFHGHWGHGYHHGWHHHHPHYHHWGWHHGFHHHPEGHHHHWNWNHGFHHPEGHHHHHWGWNGGFYHGHHHSHHHWNWHRHHHHYFHHHHHPHDGHGHHPHFEGGYPNKGHLHF